MSDVEVTIDGQKVEDKGRVSVRHVEPETKKVELDLPVDQVELLERRAEGLGITLSSLIAQILAHEEESVSPLKLTRYTGQPTSQVTRRVGLGQ